MQNSLMTHFVICAVFIQSKHYINFWFYSVDTTSHDVVAAKIIDLEEAEDEIEDIQQEITVLSQCDSEFVTKYYGSYLKVRN